MGEKLLNILGKITVIQGFVLVLLITVEENHIYNKQITDLPKKKKRACYHFLQLEKKKKKRLSGIIFFGSVD